MNPSYSPRAETSQGQLGPSSRDDTGLLGYSHCLLTKMVTVGWGGLCPWIDTEGRWVAGGPVPELRETEAHRPCGQTLGYFTTLLRASQKLGKCPGLSGDSWS